MVRAYSPRDCARELIALLEEAGDDPSRLASEGGEALARLMRRPDLLKIGVPRQTVHSVSGTWLYCDGEIAIVTALLGEGQRIPVHAHRVWELLGVYRGAVNHTVYGRRGEATDDGFAKLERVEQKLLRPFDVVSLGTELDAHGWIAEPPDTYVVVAGGVPPPNRYFQLESGTYTDVAG